ncbi:hypothetical protein ACFX2G_034924 [Malus domestica]
MVTSVDGEPDISHCRDPNLQILISAINPSIKQQSLKPALLKSNCLSIIPSLNNVFSSSSRGILLQSLKGEQAAMQVYFVAAK